MTNLLILLVAALLVGLIGARRRVGFWGGFFASLVVTPLGGLILAIAVGKKPEPPPKKSR